MIEIKVDQKYVWAIRIIFLVLAIIVSDLIMDKFLQGYIISAGNTRYEVGSSVFYTHILKFVVLDFFLIFLAVRTVAKNEDSSVDKKSHGE
jgi:hypothetical protein